MLYGYFFPDDTKLKVENYTFTDGKKVWRKHYTFRSFVRTYWYIFLVNPIRDFLGYRLLDPYFSRRGAIAFDAADSGQGGAVSSITVTHVNTGNNLVDIGCNSLYDDATVTVSSMTYAGTTMTAQINNYVSGQNVLIDVRYLGNPATGSNSFVVNYNNANANSKVVGIVSFTGANTGTPIDASATNNGAAGTNEAVTVTTSNASSFLVECGGEVSTTQPTVSASETQRWSLNQSSAGNLAGVGSTRPTTTSGAYTNTWTASAGGGRWGVGIVAVNQALAVVGGGNLPLMGVG